jgi:hypothetical protein
LVKRLSYGVGVVDEVFGGGDADVGVAPEEVVLLVEHLIAQQQRALQW